MRLGRVFVPAVVMTAGALMWLAGARLPASQQQPRFRSGVEAVLVDVSVLDADRRPVRGLAAADFTVIEDGRPQAITTFSAVDVPDDEAPSAPWIRDVQPDVQTNADLEADRRIVVLVMDDAVPMPAIDVLRARALGSQAIDRLGPNDLAAVVFTMNQRHGQEFTHDRDRLRAAVSRFNGALDNALSMDINGAPVVMPFDRFDVAASSLYRATINTLRAVSEALAALPQRRKSILFVGVGIPIDISLAGPAIKIGVTEEGGVEPHSRDDTGGVSSQLINEFLDVFRAAQRANVNIYSLDPGGLRPPTSTRNALAGSTAVTANPGTLNAGFLEAMSFNTGGFAITNANDARAGIAQVFRENGSYYLLGYQPANDRADGRFRRIEVRVNRPGVTVRARGGYYEPRPLKAGTPSAEPSSLERAISAIVPKSDLGMQVAAAPFAIPGSRDTAVAIVAALRQPTPQGMSRSVENVEVVVRAIGDDGKLKASERLHVRLVVRPVAGEDTVCEVFSRLDLKPGHYQLRVAADNAERVKSGSVYSELDVPDFNKASLSMSGALLSVAPGPAVVGKDKFVALTAVVPTALRAFDATSRVSVFVRIYQGGRGMLKPVLVTARVADQRGITAHAASDVLEPQRFSAARSTDHQVDLPVAGMGGGQYLLSIEAWLPAPGATAPDSSGKPAARRDVRFSVR